MKYEKARIGDTEHVEIHFTGELWHFLLGILVGVLCCIGGVFAAIITHGRF